VFAWIQPSVKKKPTFMGFDKHFFNEIEEQIAGYTNEELKIK